MHLLHLTQLLQSLANIKHGRQLNHHFFSLLQKQVLQIGHIGRTVGNRNGLASVLVPSGRVNEDAIFWFAMV